jgi:hypothetical protein
MAITFDLSRLNTNNKKVNPGMQNNKKGALAAFLGLIAIATFVTSQKVFSNSPLILINQEQTDESQIPVTDYLAPKPTDPAERSKRKEKSRRYSSKVNRIKDEPSIALITSSESSIEWIPALPVTLSNAVIIGEITNSEAYLSDDRNGVYTEFTVRIEEVLKSDGELPLVPGATIIAEREGGGVRFPSGHVQRYVVSGEGMPKVRSRYTLFLKSNGPGQDFRLLRGYELRNGLVFPLDKFVKDAAYKNMDQDVFINKVHSVINDPPQNTPSPSLMSGGSFCNLPRNVSDFTNQSSKVSGR